ncbi:MAG: hypothetical protein HYW70_01335 [Candidatus Nealsonbacteria bacterium]|nr:hypothetical protein [Candidatus Nealsonbacteria bacterium]
MPLPAFNIINGGAHADNELDIQEFMVVPRKKRFRDNFQTGKDISEKLTKIAEKRFGVVKMGDEGGLSLPVKTSEEALSLISEAIWGKNDIRVILDCAASQFYKKGFYGIAGKRFNKEGLVNYYSGIVKKYPIIGLEDPFAQDDWEGWKMLGSKLKKVLIIGDDLLVTNPKRIRLAKKRNACNGVIIKINQVGTVTEAIEAAKLAKSYGWKIMVSHRSGETMDDFIADFAVGIDADFIKAGAPTRPERLIKYNRLLEIEKEMS